EIESPGRIDGIEVFALIRGADPLVVRAGELELAPLHDVTRVRKGRNDLTSRVGRRVAAGVVEVEMRVEDDIDVAGDEPRGAKDPLGGPHLEAVDVALLVVPLRAGAVVDEDAPLPVVDEEDVHPEANAVPLVRRPELRPERLRDDPEHGAAVEPKG